MKPWQKAAGGAAALITAGTLAFVTKLEGEGPKNADGEYTVYFDVAGVATVCAGITGPEAVPGATYNEAECEAMLRRELTAHGNGMLACVSVPISRGEFDAYASFTYNLGVGTFCNSTLRRKLNALDRQGACLELLKFKNYRDRSKPKVQDPKTGRWDYPLVESKGLRNRRQAEYKLCVKDL